jgi:cell division protein FtsL
MIRVNLVLTLLVVLSAFYLVHTQYESRRYYTAVDRAQARTRLLESEHEQLQVLKREQAKPARIQQQASRALQMQQVSPGVTQYVTVQTPAGNAGDATNAGARP